MKYFVTRLPTLLLASIIGLFVSSSAFGQATIIIENGDAAGVGFNDTTAVAPVGGNGGTTLGQQRLIAFQTAANIWGASISSTPSITIHASWAALACSASSGTLGQAGATSQDKSFPGAPFSGTWYSIALANALYGAHRNGATPEINATFNVNLGTSMCLSSLHWYYGLDTNHGSTGVDLVTVLLHEFAHGLGFQTFTSSSTGAQSFGFPSIYDRFLFDNTAGKTWAQMTTDAERQASAINTNKLVWNGPQVTSDVPIVLTGTPRLKVNSPPLIAGNYAVGTADFGAPLSSSGITADVVQATPNDGCSAIGGAVSGKIALIDRGNCTFVSKVKNAQNAGAVGVIIADNVSSSTPPGMGGSDPTITIPTVSITLADGNTIKAQLGSGVNATLLLDPSSIAGADSSGRPLMYTPNPVVSGSSVSHWDTSEFPNQLMEPNISNDLTHSVTPPQDLTRSLLKDIGWPTGTPPPAPSPTPTPSPPPNDNFANAQVVSGCSGSVTGTNVAATKEAGEPNNPDSPTSTRSVWYQWQAPSTGSATIDTLGSDFDTVLAVYTGSSLSGLTLVAHNDDAVAMSVFTSTVTFNATQGTIYRITVNGFDNSSNGGDTGNIQLNWAETGCTSPTVQLSASNYTVGEGDGHATITVNRTGDTSGAATVDYRTTDTDTFTVGCAAKNGTAFGRCDYATVVGTLSFGAGEASKTFLIPIIDDSYAEGPETFGVALSNPTGATLGAQTTATVTINDNETVDGPNPILLTNDAGIAFFVRQHYLDFLGREPEVGEPWSPILRNCSNQFNTDPASPAAGCDRITVSGAFFGSPEFKGKGLYLIDFYRVAFNRLPQYAEFSVDLASITGATAAETNAKRAAFANNFVLRTEFVNAYGAMSNSTYVTTLMSHMGQYNLTSITTPDPANPDGTVKVTLTTNDLINRLNGVGGTLTRAQVLRAIVQSDEVTLNLEAVNAFVASQYYGYLRRTPDTGGFNSWVNYLGAHPSDFRTMVNGFVNSTEYRLRFGPP